MLTTSGILTLVATILGSFFCCLVLTLLLKEYFKIKISSTMFILLGISIMVFDVAVLKDLVPYGLDQVFSAIGFGFCLFGFFNGIDIKKNELLKRHPIKPL